MHTLQKNFGNFDHSLLTKVSAILIYPMEFEKVAVSNSKV